MKRSCSYLRRPQCATKAFLCVMSAGKQQRGTQGSSPGGPALQALCWPSMAVPPPPLGDLSEGPGPTLAWSGPVLLAFLLGPLLSLVNPRSACLFLLHNCTD